MRSRALAGQIPPPKAIAIDLNHGDPATLINHLAGRLEDLQPHRADPDRYHVQKDELVRAFRKLARRLAGDDAKPVHAISARQPRSAWSPPKRD